MTSSCGPQECGMPGVSESQTYHIGLSVYGPNKEGKFRGAISIESESKFSEEYDSFEDAKRNSLNMLAELVETE